MPTNERESSYRYRIDEDDRVQFVSREWVEFGRQNAATDLSPAAVLGRSLWEFIADDETRHLYRQLFTQVRKDGRSRTVPFRCDGPVCRRYMQLRVSKLEGGVLAVTSQLLREVSRDSVPVMSDDAARSDDFLLMCSWCKRVKLDESWLEVEDAINQLDLFAAPVLPRISHGVCLACERNVLAQIEG